MGVSDANKGKRAGPGLLRRQLMPKPAAIVVLAVLALSKLGSAALAGDFAAGDGEKLAEYPLRSPPVWDGMAAAHG